MGTNLRITDFKFALTQRKLVIVRLDRPALPHLTVDWLNKSNVLDVHLNWVQTGRYDPILQIPMEYVQDFLRLQHEYRRRHAIKAFRRYRPGWLMRNGFTLLLLNHEDLRAAVKQAVPKLQGDFTADVAKVEAIKDLLEHCPASGLNVLRDFRVQCGPFPGAELSVSAVRGFPKREQIILSYQTVPGHGRGWWGFTTSSVEQLHRTLIELGRRFVSKSQLKAAREALSLVLSDGSGVSDGQLDWETDPSVTKLVTKIGTGSVG